MSVRNLEYIRSMDPKLYEAFTDIIQQVGTVSQQVNGNQTGLPNPPPSISGLQVTGKNGHFSIAIQDEGPIYRDIHYYLEHADNPHFINPTVIHMGHSRNHNIFLGSVTRYWRAYSAYASSSPGRAIYFGSSANPRPVIGGGSIEGPDFLSSQGSGTGNPGTGLQGPGTIPFRSANGAPPKR